uniref:Uncharacterized protein n=1 Tax=Romanomermis culicivorax TaxID=13658 RepID=A0A915IGC9_ROMCU
MKFASTLGGKGNLGYVNKILTKNLATRNLIKSPMVALYADKIWSSARTYLGYRMQKSNKLDFEETDLKWIRMNKCGSWFTAAVNTEL